ncbi:MAG: hypothetical protein RMI83_04560 [Desulfurococcaceae archaeon]|nr:hypothetical protein [Sulfolobales archaeon]MDW8170355.1 hypothetical protein [Desulfurococcaceae archaeon]
MVELMNAAALRTAGALALLCISLQFIYIQPTAAASSQFILLDYSYTSQSGSTAIYPGSMRVELLVNILYNGTDVVSYLSGCINLPQGFSPSRGYSTCSPPYSTDYSAIELLEPGTTFTLKYYIDVSKAIAPGTYYPIITLYYVVNREVATYNVTGVSIKISHYPPVELVVENTYWTPNAYPGSSDVYLNIVLRNRGDSRVLSGSGIIQLPPQIFTPSEVSVFIGEVSESDYTTITIGGLSIAKNASPGTYYGLLKLTATAVTNDGVTYSSLIEASFSVALSEPPAVEIALLDYGFTSLRPSIGMNMAKLYIRMQHQDSRGIVLQAIAVYIRALRGATFTNSSNVYIATLSGPYGYGDFFTVTSSELSVSEGLAVFQVDLVAFGTVNGAEFWSNQSYVIQLNVSIPQLALGVVDAYWSSGLVYPGTQGVDLGVVIENLDAINVVDALVKILLPKGFSPEVIGVSEVSVASGSRTTVIFRSISIDPEVRPGVYVAKLVIDGVALARDGSFYRIHSEYSMLLSVSSSSIQPLDIVSITTNPQPLYATATGGSTSFTMQLVKPVSATGLCIEVILSPPIAFSDGSRSRNYSLSGSYAYGDFITFTITNMDLTNATEGLYPIVVVAKGMLIINGAESWFSQTIMALLEVKKPYLNISIVGSGWFNGYSSSESRGSSIYVRLQSYSRDPIATLIAVLEPLTSGVTVVGSSNATWSSSTPIGYGEVVTIVFSNIDVEASAPQIMIRLHLRGVIRSSEASYIATSDYVIKVPLLEDNSLLISRIATQYRGTYAPLLPSSRDLEIVATLINLRPEPITSVAVELVEVPHVLKVKDYGGCSMGIGSGSSCDLTLLVDVSNDAAPGMYLLVLRFKYYRSVGGAIVGFKQVFEVPIVIDDGENYAPDLVLATWYWGRAGQPTTVLEHQRMAPVTISILNRGRYSASSITVELTPLNESIKPILSREVCSPSLAPSYGCIVTLYVDLAEATAGQALFNLSISYVVTSYNAHLLYKRSFTIPLRIEEYAAGKGLKLIQQGWSNDWPTYPNTENATFTVALANMWPYTIRGISALIHLPNGFTSVNGSKQALSYDPGPLNSLSTATLSFTITVGEIPPGLYNALLEVNYVVEVGGADLAWIEYFNASIVVHNDSRAIELLTPTWLGQAPSPGSYGATLVVSFRNNDIPRISGSILEIELPEGFTCSLNNSTYAAIASGGYLPIQQAYGIPQVLELQQIVKYLNIQYQAPQPVGVGNVFTFYIPLNILIDKPGVFYANAYVNVIDHWSNVRRMRILIPIEVLGSSQLIVVRASPTLKFQQGVGFTNITLINEGYSPIHEVYVYIIPQSPVAIPLQSAFYISRIEKEASFTVEFIYNPLNIMTGLGGTTVRYMSLPLMVSVLFKDVLGYQRFINTSTSVIIEPFIDLRVISTKAELRGSTLIVSGVLANYGLATARSIEVAVTYSGLRASTFIGDLDSASQTAFRVELSVNDTISKEAIIELDYRDEYYRLESMSFNITVVQIPITTTIQPLQKWPIIEVEHYLVIAIVAVFLTVFLLLLYRYLRKLGGRISVSEETG